MRMSLGMIVYVVDISFRELDRVRETGPREEYTTLQLGIVL